MSFAPRVLLCALLGLTAGLLAISGEDGADASEQPVGLWFPWEAGTSWRLTNGPHGAGEAALDLQPPDAAGVSCDADFTSSTWVVAAAPGTVIDRANGLEIDHGSGFRTGYLHIEDKQVRSGHVDAGDRLGKVSCCPDGGWIDFCWATAPHLHFYTVYRGAKQSIVGINIEGWTVDEDGCLSRGEEVACIMGWLKSGAPAHTPTDVETVLILDATGDLNTGDPHAARLAAARSYLAAAGPDDRIGIVTFNSIIHGNTPLRDVKGKFGMDRALLRRIDRVGADGKADLRVGVRGGCRELTREGEAERRAAILISDGVHDFRRFGEPQRCFLENGWPVHTIAIAPGGEEALERIARETGGQFVNWSVDPDPTCAMHRLRAVIAGTNGHACKTEAASVDKNPRLEFEVPEGQGQATFAVSWLRPDVPSAVSGRVQVEAELVTPSGRALSPERLSDNLKYEAGATYAFYSVLAPQPGVWSVRATAVQAPAEGVAVTVGVTTAEARPQAPPPGEEAAPEETPAAEDVLPSPTPIRETPTDEKPTPSPDGTPDASATPAPKPKPKPTAGTPTVTPEPTPEPTPDPTPEPAPEPTVEPPPEPPPP